MFWLFVILYALAFGVICSLAAKSRARDPFDWFLLGFIFGVFGLIAVLVMERPEGEEEIVSDEWPMRKPYPAKTKKCPDCAEEIKIEAKVCRFCGKQFTENDDVVSIAIQSKETLVKKDSKPLRIKNVMCPRCSRMNYENELLCSYCDAELPPH